VRYGGTTVIITSDIDTMAERSLAEGFGYRLASDIIVVPHHGSAGSADDVFYGYVNPDVAVISCGIGNTYGFPAKKVMDLLYQMKVRPYITATTGTVTAISNGYYWDYR
jgi:beta-lactamase superfamily II metal-dependent hydrolase